MWPRTIGFRNHHLLSPSQSPQTHRGLALTCVLVLWCANSVPSFSQTVDENLPATNGAVLAAALSGNTLYIGGSFTRVGRAGGGAIRLDAASGKLLSEFPKVIGWAQAAAPDGNGGWFIGGQFSSVGGLPRNNLAHILADNTVAPWNPGASDGSPPQVAIDALEVFDGVVYVGGSFTKLGGQPRNSIGAVDAVTGLATAWNPNALTAGFHGRVKALVVTENTVYAGGSFSEIGGQRRISIAALDRSSGQATASLAIGAPGPGVETLLLDGNTLYVGGAFTRLGGQDRFSLGSYDLTTGTVTGWDPHPQGGGVSDLAVSSPVVFVAGSFCTIGGQQRSGIAALDANTGLATSWNLPTDAPCQRYFQRAAVIDQTVYLQGNFSEIGGQPRGGLAAVDVATGALKPWDPDLGGNILAVNAGTVFMGGFGFLLDAMERNSLAAIDLSTGDVTPWNPDPDGQVSALAVDQGTVYVGGIQYTSSGFTRIGGQPRANLAAVDATTGLAAPWNPNPTGGGYSQGIWSIAVNCGTVYVGGCFSEVGGQVRNNLAALDATTGLATAWNPNVTAPGSDVFAEVRALLVSGPAIVAGGAFTEVGGQARNSLAAIDLDSGRPTSWNPNLHYHGFPGLVYAMAEKANTIYVGGLFTDMDGQGRNGLAAVDAKTGLATSWDPEPRFDDPRPNPIVTTLAVGAQTVYAGGHFDQIGGQPRKELAALDAKTGTARDWDPKLPSFGVSDQSSALLVHGHTVYAGGGFWRTGETAQGGLAAIEAVHGESEPKGRLANRLNGSRAGGSTSLLVSDHGPAVAISYTLSKPGPARIVIFDVAGRTVGMVIDGLQTAGAHQVNWDGRGLADGLYFYRLEAGGEQVTKRAIHLH